tara:strand:+ start:109 stop:531 length:423 start_codon:yes stop_codon:yes gene_type:complete
MATINASISVTSDIMSYPVTISKTMTMTKAGSCNGLENTSGLNSKKVQSETAFLLFSNADATTLKASKVYVRNTGSDKAESFTIGYGEDLAAATIETIGKLHGGDWMLIPWDAVAATTHDIYAFASTAEAMTIEYMAFIE